LKTEGRTVLRISSIAAFVLLFLSASSALAQIPRYRPPGGPTMPRALDYFRRDVGVLDPYNTFVAPRRQLDRNLQSLQAQEDYNARRAQQEISQIRQSTAAPTGTGATFMNYSHYFPRGNTAGRAPRR
jgi:hypothetical protein